ncbi:transcriptional coactivator hfi1 [Ophiostoma piceae UAMH 11346]|uniref:Transcriptional coactivator hfi1 n=1 Tax=Ophiostoma piceae (strain UAMH 11346) TaxID=1262450 RepID=S3CEW3_OPHP1|nr:transcriptional coactivator hfi1 [Ophiostoma piceae UAMH 11346]
MPDINPADLSRPAVGLSTPILATKSITVSSTIKSTKTSQIIPPRIELEQAYTALKSAIGIEQWKTYKTATTQFFIGRLSQAEFSNIIDPILASPHGEREHLHNQLIAAIYGNVTREMPDQGLAPWVSANDKPSPSLGSKPNSGDANERRLKGEVMLLPSKDRRRIKDITLNEPFDPYDALSSVFADQRPRAPRPSEAQPQSASGGLNRMNLDLEIRKRFTQPLAVESGEFPDTSNIESRMLPFCYEAGLVSGHAAEAANYMSLATEAFVKEFLTSVFSRTRSNGPGEYGSAGFGGNNWVQTRKYRRQLAREEERALHGEIHRDKMGLLPVEAKRASERGPLGVAEFRIALEMGDCGLTHFPIVGQSLMASYREGELENYDDHTWIDGHHETNGGPLEPSLSTLHLPSVVNGTVSSGPADASGTASGAAGVVNGAVGPVAMKKSGSSAGAIAVVSSVDAAHHASSMTNATDYPDLMDLDTEENPWEGADSSDVDFLGNVLDSCLAVG